MAKNWFGNEVGTQMGGMLAGDTVEGPGDAMRHAMTAALYTQKYGPWLTGLFGDINEWMNVGMGGNNLANEADQINNALGIEIGQAATTPEEAAMMVLDQARRSIGQESYWGWNPSESDRLDTSVPMSWNRQHYGESPSDIKKQIDALQRKLDEGMFRQQFDYFR